MPGGSGNEPYAEAVAQLDEDMNQYIHDNTEDELTHEVFINAYLAAHGAPTVNLDAFRTLPSSKAIRSATDRTSHQPDATHALTPLGSPVTAAAPRTPTSVTSFRRRFPASAVGQHPAFPGPTLT